MHSRSYLPQALKLFAIFALVSLSASQATPQRKNDFDLVGNGSGGGVICAACTIIVGLLANDSHPIPPPGSADLQPPIISNLDKGLGMISHVCNLVKLKSPLCGSDTQAKIQQMVLDGTSPDAICLDIGLCTDPTCRLYEETLYASADERPVVARASLHFAIRPLLQNNFPSWVSVAPAPEPDHLPLVDEDGDRFSTWPYLRGSNWRGKDCNDSNPAFYPGSKKFSPLQDHNCNGISGINPSNKAPYELEFCAASQQRGVVILGDSAGAHFSIPSDKILNSLDAALDLGLDEADFPQCSWATGFEPANSTSHASTKCPNSRLPMNSFYQRLRERNLCNHRDFQNIAVNGARSTSMYNGILETMARHPYDQPAIVFYALVGNDVCNPHPGAHAMTTPEEFREMVLNATAYLDTGLPSGSHVVFVGLLPGEMMWNTMAQRAHPSLNPITYGTLWDYLNCLQVNPCWGFLNSNATWREFTSQRAEQLNAVYKEIISTTSFRNFDMMYLDYPINQTVVNNWADQGYDPAELFEWIGGGHPSQTAHMLTAEYIWNTLSEQRPDILGPENPYNVNITATFGDQGGY